MTPSEIPAQKLEQLALQAETRAVSAIQPAYDLDRLTLAHERQITYEQSSSASLVMTAATNSEKVVLYIPDSDGRYSEKRSIACIAETLRTTTVIFRLEKFSVQFPLRFDPCQCPGLIRIDSITAFDFDSQKLVWRLNARDLRKLTVGGTAFLANRVLLKMGGLNRRFFNRNGSTPGPAIDVISTGLDPQLILPALPKDVGFPLLIFADMKLLPSKSVSVAQSETGSALAVFQE